MNKSRGPRQQRRYSLPAASSLTPSGYRGVPEGSDTFQKALEELYTSEPHHAPWRNDTGVGPNGLNNIIEGNESDFVESEEEIQVGSDDERDVITLNRRHSSPLFLHGQDGVDGSFQNGEGSVRKLHNSLIKSHSKYRKEYFIKHGHWPTVNNSNSKQPSAPAPKQSRPKSYKHSRSVKHQDVACGTSTKTVTSNMAKLRV